MTGIGVTQTLAAGILLLIAAVIFLLIRIHTHSKKIETLIQAHNALAEDFASSVHYIRTFEKIINDEDRK